MEIDISGRHFQVTAPLKGYIAEKVKKLDKYSLKIESVHVILAVQKFINTAEITLLGKNLRVTAKTDSADMYAAFDNCFGVIQLQLGRQHDRIKDHKARSHPVKADEKDEE
jgi:putative sigma-54 modulation protein